MDPNDINTRDHLAAALQDLQGGRSLRQIEAAAKNVHAPDGRRLALPSSTVSDFLNGKSVPEIETLVAFLTVCGVDSEEKQRPWLEARERTENQRRPPGTVRVRDARPRLLGVHAAIQTSHTGQTASGQDGNELPLYVPRDLDADLRTKITVAAQQGGFVLLLGDSSVGKTRALFEAVRAVLPNWWLLHPADADAVRAFAGTPATRTVVWLDELQNYLDHPAGLPSAAIRSLIETGVIVVATMWPGEYAARIAPRTAGRPDPYAGDRQLLNLAAIVTVSETFSARERKRALDLAISDSRIRAALDTPDAGFTQVMAAGPELVRWWEQAPEEQCYGKAIITAALDARRVGARAPLSRDYLTAAAPGYLTKRQQAGAPPDWLDQALKYATTPLHGATATLCPIPAGMGQIVGYQVADYLHQHALRIRRTAHLPDTAWRALVHHHHTDDAERLAGNAQSRGRIQEAAILHQERADLGHPFAIRWLAELLIEQGQVDEALTRLRPLADADDVFAADRLAELLIEQGRIDELTHRADVGDSCAARRLAMFLVEQGRIDELTHRADARDPEAADRDRLVDLLLEQGQDDEALTRLRSQADADADNLDAANRLVDLLLEHGQVDEALTRLRSQADAYNSWAAYQLARQLAKLGRIDELTHRADAGDPEAAIRLAELLIEQGQVDEALTRLRSLADDNPEAAIRLAELLIEQDRIDEVTHRADTGDPAAAEQLTILLAKQGRTDELTHRADAGDPAAAHRLATFLREHGRTDELTHRADAGDMYATTQLANLLIERDQIDEALPRLRSLADADLLPAGRLADVLLKHRRLDELKAEVAAGTFRATEALRELQSGTRDA